MDEKFWSALDSLVKTSEIKIDRPRGSTHPSHSMVTYPLDYGYLVGTHSGDQGGIDLWIGSLERQGVTAIVCTIDLHKADAEIKILLGCTENEAQEIWAFHNQGTQSGKLIARNTLISTN